LTHLALLLLLLLLLLICCSLPNPAVGGVIGFSLAYGGGSAVSWYEPKPGSLPAGIVPVSLVW
jgi:hypothetical protein